MNADVPSCDIEGSSIKIIGIVLLFADLICLICHKAFIVRVLTIISLNVSSYIAHLPVLSTRVAASVKGPTIWPLAYDGFISFTISMNLGNDKE